MGLGLHMIGLMVRDMPRAVAFYRELGLDIPEGAEETTHVQVEMGPKFFFFLDSAPVHWDPAFASADDRPDARESDFYPSLFEYWLRTEERVRATYDRMVGLGYQGYRAPYDTSFACFAMLKDTDGNVVLLSGRSTTP